MSVLPYGMSTDSGVILTNNFLQVGPCSNGTISNSVEAVVCSSIIYNAFWSDYNTSTGELIINNSGVYKFIATIPFNQNTGFSSTVYLTLNQNGAVVVSQAYRGPVFFTDYNQFNCVLKTTLSASAGDSFFLYLHGGVGANLTSNVESGRIGVARLRS